MSNKVTNFFEILIAPAIQDLFLTEIHSRERMDFTANVYTHFARDVLISLYPLSGSRTITPKSQYIEWLVRTLVFNALERSSAIFDIDYRNGEFSILDERLVQQDEYSILRRVIVRVFQVKGKLLLAADPISKIYSRVSLAKLLSIHGFSPQDFSAHNSCLVFVEKDGERKWARGSIRDATRKVVVKVEVPTLFDGTIEVSPSRVIPILSKTLIGSIVGKRQSSVELDKEVKRVSEFTSEEKLETTQNIFDKYLASLFPLTVRETSFNLGHIPLDANYFPCYQIPSDSEPSYIIRRKNHPQVKSKQRLAGLSKVKITSEIKDHKVVLFATRNTLKFLDGVVSQLNDGISQNGYSFSLPARFGIKLVITDKFVANDYREYERASDIFLQSTEEKHKDALALAYLPLQSDLYYPFKAKLAHHGKVSQVISKSQFDIYGCWNLATNIFAKLGYEPWGISESPNVPNADIVLGFAYSSLKNDGHLKRNIGYVNVFDKNGVWLFMQSASSYFDFEKRLRLIPQMIKTAILGYLASGDSPKIIDIHYSKRFSYQERKNTFAAILEVVPTVQEVNFISIDRTHPLRVFDKANVGLNFLRGGIVQLNPSEFLLAIAGESKPKALASRLLRVRVWREPLLGEIDVQPIAFRILAMAKLNWRSAVRETIDPVTLKYAEEIARLTNHFSLTEWDTVNNQLYRIPWFI